MSASGETHKERGRILFLTRRWSPAWARASWFILLGYCMTNARSSRLTQGQRDTEHRPAGPQCFSHQLGSWRGALGNGAAVHGPADRHPSGDLGGLLKDAVGNGGQGWGQCTDTAYCKPRMCPAPTLTYGFRAACPSGTGVIPSLRGLGWERVPLSRAGQRRMQLTCSCWDDGQQMSHCQQQQGLGILFQIR